jgi:GAF domain-containing protein/anti-sigma regulatory factor (Ser/Thr protein kinase)
MNARLRRPLFRKYVALFVAVVSVALLINGALEVWFSYQEHKASLIRIQREQAEAAAAKIGQFVKEIESQIGWTTQLPWSASTIEQRRFDGLRLLRQVPAITELSMIDSAGKEQLRVSRLAMDVVGSGLDLSKESKFALAAAKKVYYGPVYFRRESEPYMTLSLAGTRRDSGVSIAEVNLKLIWEVISKIKVGERGNAYVVDANGRLIAHPDISLVLRNTDMSGLSQIQAARAADAGASEPIREVKNAQGKDVLAAFAPVPPLGWHVLVELPIDEAYAPLYGSMQRTGLVMLAALFAAALSGMLLARRMVGPIQTLREGAARIGSGDLGQRIEVTTGDEVEALAREFNDMAGRLQESYADLENKVEMRTRELSEALGRQTATAQVLQAISRSTFDLETVLNTLVESAANLCEAEIATITKQKEGLFYRTAIHGFPPEFAERMKGIPIELDRGTATGRAMLEGRTIHIEDVTLDPDYAWTEAQEAGGFRALMGVPLLRDGVPIGAMALGRQEARPFTAKQIELVSTFADQAVIAIENARLFEEVQARTRELQESLEYQTATSEVLNVISRSPSYIQPVLDTIVNTASRLCEAHDAAIFLRDGEWLRKAAHHGPIPLDLERWPLKPTWVTGRVVLERRAIQIEDAFTIGDEYPDGYAQALRFGHRSLIVVPLVREREAIGAVIVRRTEVRRFSDKQIAVLQTFADQAVIAIENVRLFDEVQARTRDLQESLEYQTATSDVLGVISRSPTDLQPALQSIVEIAAGLCEGFDATILLKEGEALRVGAHHGPIVLDFDRKVITPDWVTGRAVLERKPIHVHDFATARSEFPEGHELHLRLGHRTGLAIPLLQRGEAIGAFMIRRKEVSPFSEKQVAILQTFADQAVIAINNVRLFEEVQARTGEVQESLEYQTATSDVLGVISRSPSELQPVMEAIVSTAARLCSAEYSFIVMCDDTTCRLVAANNVELAHNQFLARNPVAINRDTIVGRTALDKATIHIPDVLSDPEFKRPDWQAVGKQRTVLGVPLLREGRLLGVMILARTDVRPFSEKQVDLVTTFADQAVIAINNVRLFEEVQARTHELARSVSELQALGEVTRAVNSTLDLEKVLDTIVAKAVQLSGTDAGAIYVYSAHRREYRLRATYGMDEDLVRAVRRQTGHLGSTSVRDAVARREPVQVPDLHDEPPSPIRDLVLQAGYRAVLIVPLLRPDQVLGALVVRRREPGEFDEATKKLLMTFAEQSVLAIQNARLFSEIEEKGRQLELASRHKSQFLANMSHELRTPLNSVLGFTEMMADGLYGPMPDKAKTALAKVQANGKHLLGLINDVLDLSKIEAGQLMLSIDDYSLGHVVTGVVASTESLAKAKGLVMQASVPPALPIGRGDERRLTQVVINLVGNAIKFTDAGSVDIVARSVDGFFEIDVRDTGPGISPDDQKRIFEEFQQVDDSSTRTKGGTGLGLAISRRIVEMHGGTLTVQSNPGEGSTFRVRVPVKAEEAREAA